MEENDGLSADTATRSAARRLFGKAVAELREAKGLTQKEVAAQSGGHYSDESTYRRVELGARTPSRDAAIAILRHGLALTDAEAINRRIALLGYDPLSGEEIRRCALVPCSGNYTAPMATKPRPAKIGFWKRATESPHSRRAAVFVFVGTVILSAWIAWVSGHLGLWLTTSGIYASLYAISLFLETACAANRVALALPATVLFSFMLFSSVIALALDALVPSLAVFGAAALLQWLLFRPVLPDSAVVAARFQSHTAQTAHLKNTLYFLFLVVAFWVPPANCISALRQQVRMGNSAPVRAVMGQGLIVTDGAVCLNAGWLWGIYAATFVFGIGAGVHLLENLKYHPKLNSYTALLYLRALLYFSLGLICVGWYSYSLSTLLP